MFNNNSDYAHNKRTDAIVYISVSGTPVRLTRDEFFNEAEFQRWKLWSDGDYKATEQEGRSFYDNCIPVDERLDYVCAVSSAEDVLIGVLAEAEQSRAHSELFAKVKNCITRKQFRRLWMFHVEGMNISEIARIEHVTQPSVSESLIRAIKKIVESFKNAL